MVNRENRPLERHHVSLYQGNWEDLAAIFNPRRVQPGTAIRLIVDQWLKNYQSAQNDLAKPVEVNLDDLDITVDGSEAGQPGGPVLPKGGSADGS